ncbi:phytoene/squalene synthase family protein [Pannonibacter tanglangensis]|uniref:Squalene/phytoene synthase family protein n=1 Tax=Pannonibacter tanglangensis TaxID=2750084 RepID=A0ABW9ZFC3_9HYPH|nr:phytoene/squalene synthase family protein [Pannonibacter sp. XCT-34]NBN63136.1 squalene/phytoene synthase family protein [Pannonibacter sp. XCT-34]
MSLSTSVPSGAASGAPSGAPSGAASGRGRPLPRGRDALPRPVCHGPAYGFSGHLTDLRACAGAIRKGSRSFHLASALLPADIRSAAQALYAFCRHADDLIDDPRANRHALDQLRLRLELIYDGRPADHACDRAFARTVAQHAIPKELPAALLDGFDMDISRRHYGSIAEVKAYATCVASSVGLMMALVMGTGEAAALARAADLGIAMQLTNIARDVGEDARNGRLYLPADWLDEAGVDAADLLRAPRFSPALGRVVQRLLAEAGAHYRLGHAGIAALPAPCRPAIRSAALVYEAIGNAVAAQGHDSVSSRAHTSLAGKLSLILRACLPVSRSGDGLPGAAAGAPQTAGLRAPADPAAAALVSAAAAAALRPGSRPAGRATGTSGQTPATAEPGSAGLAGSGARVLEILMRLQAHQIDARRGQRPPLPAGRSRHA